MDLRLTPARRKRRRKIVAAMMLQDLQKLVNSSDGGPVLDIFKMTDHSCSNFMVTTMFSMLLRNGTVKYRIGRNLWTAHPENEFGTPCGFWEKEVLGTWERAKLQSIDWWRTAWIANFRMEQKTFRFLLQRYRHLIVKQTTHLRRTISPGKRLAILLYYLGQGETFSEIGALFHVGTTTARAIVHELVESLVAPLTADSIVFPVGEQLQRTMRRFEEMSTLPLCCGAVDGTFILMVKPEDYGDSYWCYKQHSAILLLACVDSRGLFTFVDIGPPGSVGDAAVFNGSALKAKLIAGEWGNFATWQCNGKTVRPFVVGDSAFALSPVLMKIIAGDNLTPAAESFNYTQIRTRRVVECAFGRLKERFNLVHETNSNDPQFVSKAGLICCALHNIIERRHLGHLPCYRNYAPTPLLEMHSSSGEDMRNALATFVHSL